MKTFVVATLAALSAFFPAQAQDFEENGQINEIPFETVPGDSLIQGAGGIGLQADVTVSGNLTATGVVESAAGGFRYPDGSLQITAAGASEGFSANAGMYANRIADFVPSLPFSEICFKNGQVFGDIHVTSETTRGGDCVPGDLGWVMERNQRAVALWENARVACLLEGMRLPEPFEYIYSCRNAGVYGLNGMTGDWEWSSNSTMMIRINTANGLLGIIAGGGNCNSSSIGWVGNSNNGAESYFFRCLR